MRQELKETYSALEEAKADISGLFAIQHMIDKGVMPKSLEQSLYTTYLASAFRSIRFGVNEAHGKGIAIQLNYLLDQRGFVVNGDGTFAVNKDRMKEGVAGLTRDIMTIQAEGNYAAAKALGEKMGVVRPPSAEGARQAAGDSGGHRAAVRHRRRAREAAAVVVRTFSGPPRCYRIFASAAIRVWRAASPVGVGAVSIESAACRLRITCFAFSTIANRRGSICGPFAHSVRCAVTQYCVQSVERGGVRIRASHRGLQRQRHAIVLTPREHRVVRLDLRPDRGQQADVAAGRELRIARQELQRVGRVRNRVHPAVHRIESAQIALALEVVEHAIEERLQFRRFQE